MKDMSRLKMTKLSKAPLRQILKEEGGEFVADKALLLYREEVERYAYALASRCVAFSKHAGRKTVYVADVKIATE